jgi:hypothetical protein
MFEDLESKLSGLCGAISSETEDNLLDNYSSLMKYKNRWDKISADHKAGDFKNFFNICDDGDYGFLGDKMIKLNMMGDI